MKWQLSIWLFTLLSVIGCDYTKHQKVAGHIKLSETEYSAGIIILANGEKQKLCEGRAVIAAVKPDGRFELVRDVRPGIFDVRVQEDTLCLFHKNGLQVIWRSPAYGPAPEAIKFECDLLKPNEDKCDVYFRGDSDKEAWNEFKLSRPEDIK